MKKFIIFSTFILLVSGCNISQSAKAITPVVSSPEITTLSPEDVNSTLEANIAIYKSTINEFQEKKVDVLISISERSTVTYKSPDDKDKLRELYDKQEYISKQMAELPTPIGLENVQAEFQLIYEYTKEYIDCKKSLLIGIDTDIVNQTISLGEKINEHNRIAFDYLK